MLLEPMIKANRFMKAALEAAAEAGQRGEVPVGAAIVSPDGEILAEAGNRVLEMKDPTAHAEILAIRVASQILSNERLEGCDIYVTLEPCAMCAQAISLARIRRLYYSADDPKGGGVENGPRVFHHTTCHHRPEIYGGIGHDESKQLLRDFFSARR
jgi:tRNA(Arg) A34 adenosine deaminase TadA